MTAASLGSAAGGTDGAWVRVPRSEHRAGQLPHGSPAVRPRAVPGNHRDVASLLS